MYMFVKTNAINDNPKVFLSFFLSSYQNIEIIYAKLELRKYIKKGF